jgi:hypothetical protein
MKTRLSLAGSLAALAVSLPVLCQAQSGSGPAPVRVRTQIVRDFPAITSRFTVSQLALDDKAYAGQNPF